MSRRAIVLSFTVAQAVLGQALQRQAGTRGGAEDASVLLARARETVLSSTRRMPRYTCLETINREYYNQPVQKHSPRATTEASAHSCSVNQSARLSLDAEDRLRVEVAEAAQGEIHSWPGESHFDTRSIDEMIPLGPISTGSFGGYLQGLFGNSGAQVNFVGSKTDGFRNVFEYSFRVPREASTLRVKGQNIWKVTGTSGSFEIDAATTQLTKLVIETEPLSSDTGMCRAETAMDYHSMLIGGGEY